MKIREKISLILINGAILIILVSGIAINIFASNELKQINKSSIAKINDSQAHEIVLFLKNKKENSDILAAASVYRDFLLEPKDSSQYKSIKEKIDKRLTRTLEIDKDILEAYILNSDGKAVASSDKEEEGEDRSKDPYFIQAQKSAYIKPPYFYDVYKKIVFSVSSPILSDNGGFLGVSVLVFSMDGFNNVIHPEIPDTTTGENFLINKDYLLISPGRFTAPKDILVKKIETQNAKECFTSSEEQKDLQGVFKSSTANYLDYRGINIIGSHHYIADAGLCLITKEDTSEVLAPATFLTFIIILVSLGVLGIFIPIFYYITSRITKSIASLNESVKLVESGDLNRKIIIETGDEIGDLSKSFENMVGAVKKSRENVDRKVEEQTKEIKERQQHIEEQQKATVNILEDIEEEKTKIDSLLSSIGDGVIATDINANVIFINKAAGDMLGWKLEEVLGKRIYDILQMVDDKGKQIKEKERPFHIALEEKKKFLVPIQSPHYYIKKNGDKFPVSVIVSPVLIGDKLIGAIDVFHDITHEAAVDRAKTEFVSLASHQLRTPLSAINWYTEMLLAGDAGKITKDQKQYLEEVYRSNKRMVDLVNSLLNVSRIDLGTFAIVPEPIDIVEVSKSVLAELIPMIKTKKMNIEENYDKKLPKIKVDAKLIRIIFQNLLSNAVKYTPDEGRVSVSIKKQDENVSIKVEDTGYGIPEKDQARIFEKLFRADNIREKETDGTGLGLYIIKSILEQSGGSIKFESKENKGTTFYVTIPLSGMKAKEGSKGLS